MQQIGELFDDFLWCLCELLKTCNFCSDGCTNKTIRNQIIEELLDTDTTRPALTGKNLATSQKSVIARCLGNCAREVQKI